MRARITLAVFYFAFFGALGFFWPFLAAHLSALGLTPGEITTVYALLPLGALVAPPLVGLLADLLHARVWLLRLLSAAAVVAFAAFIQVGAATAGGGGGPGGLFGAAAGPAAGAVAGPTAPPGPAPMLLWVTFALFALSRAPLGPMADAATVEHSRRHGGSYGAVRLFGSVGFLAAVLSGGWLVDTWGPPAAMYGSLAALALAAAVAWVLPAAPPRPHRETLPELARLLRRGDLWLFLLTVALAQTAHSAYDSGFSIHLRQLGHGGRFTGLAWALGVVAEVGLLAVSGPLLARFGAARLLVVALAVGTLRWLLLAEVRSAGLILALQPLHAVSFGLYYVTGVTLAREEASTATQSAAQGLFGAAFALGGVVGMTLAGHLLEHYGARAMFGTAAAVAACGCLSAVALGRWRPAGWGGVAPAARAPESEGGK